MDYAQYVYDDQEGVSFLFGSNIIYWFFENYIVADPAYIPHPNEIIHYPYLLAGYLALFFTALNLLPIGQLDGGHVTFGLFNEQISRRLNQVVFSAFLFYAGLGWVHPDLLMDTSLSNMGYFSITIAVYLYFLYICLTSMIPDRRTRWLFATVMLAVQFFVAVFTSVEGYGGWLLFAFLIGRFLGVYHPPVRDTRPLDSGRQLIGWIAIVIFILSFSPRPFIIQ